MSEQTMTVEVPLTESLARIWKKGQVWFVSLAILAALIIVDQQQAAGSASFALSSLLSTAPYLLLSIGLAAYASATGADGMIARVFRGSPRKMILLAAVAGGLSPFCSCGVIPLIAALLFMGVPLAPVMAFWLASPVMDPSMFVLTAGVIGTEFAIVKTLSAVGLGLMGGTVVYLLAAQGKLNDPLRDGREAGTDHGDDRHQVTIGPGFPDLDIEPFAEYGVAETCQDGG